MTRFGEHEVEIRRQQRKSLALRVTPDGLVALIPRALGPGSERVREFIERSLERLPKPPTRRDPPLTAEELRDLVDRWAECLDVNVERIQIRDMRNKWASCSNRGNLTLNADVLQLPGELVNYILVHELLHLRFPGHAKGWQAMMSVYIPDWKSKEKSLAAFNLAGS
jgi:hypothetical protein